MHEHRLGAEGARRGLDRGHPRRGNGRRQVAYAAHPRQGLAGQLQALQGEIRGQYDHAGHRAPGPREALGQAAGDGVVAGEAHHDPHRGLDGAERVGGRVRRRHDHVRARGQDLGRHRAQPFRVSLREAGDDLQVAALNETPAGQLGHRPAAKAVHREPDRREKANPRPARRCLGLEGGRGGEGRDEAGQEGAASEHGETSRAEPAGASGRAASSWMPAGD